MNTITRPDAYAVLIEPNTLKFQRVIPGPIELVWAFLTESNLRRQWLAAGTMEMQVGAPVEFVWRNDELNDPPCQRPAGFPEEHRMQSHITELDAPHKIAFAWDGCGDVSYELEKTDNDVLLTMIHRDLPNREVLRMFAAGTHVHLDILAACVSGQKPPQFWEEWTRLNEEYATRIS